MFLEIYTKVRISPKRQYNSLYEQIYEVVRRIPPGKVATYGQIAKIVGYCTPRMVGYAMAALPHGMEVPWQRVINCQGKISVRAHGDGALRQRRLLEAEGGQFDNRGRVDLKKISWASPVLKKRF